jgi:hypothetical protein
MIPSSESAAPSQQSILPGSHQLPFTPSSVGRLSANPLFLCEAEGDAAGRRTAGSAQSHPSSQNEEPQFLPASASTGAHRASESPAAAVRGDSLRCGMSLAGPSPLPRASPYEDEISVRRNALFDSEYSPMRSSGTGLFCQEAGQVSQVE